MKNHISTGFWAVILWGVFSTSCLKLPEYPDTPAISLLNIEFIDTENSTDTLALSIDFTDGDGNLGLDNFSDVNHPFNRNYYFAWFEEINEAIKFSFITFDQTEVGYSIHFKNESQKNTFIQEYLSAAGRSFEEDSYPNDPYVIVLSRTQAGSLLSNRFTENLIKYHDRSQIVTLDTLPAFTSPYSCLNWEVNAENDTVYYQSNIHHNNIIVRFFVQQNDGSFEEFDWETLFPYPQCNTSYFGRFPILNTSDRDKPLEGTIRYSMTSIGFKNQFSIKRLKLRVEIFDRTLNRSNAIETPSFTLQEITK